mmetsp:Transcript_3208/g.9396  ORF Transcript_3208/g.9396 Transcript_3208/m.9396 type:complete len:318 (+) Transcript_3208:539-1492(+)
MTMSGSSFSSADAFCSAFHSCRTAQDTKSLSAKYLFCVAPGSFSSTFQFCSTARKTSALSSKSSLSAFVRFCQFCLTASSTISLSAHSPLLTALGAFSRISQFCLAAVSTSSTSSQRSQAAFAMSSYSWTTAMWTKVRSPQSVSLATLGACLMMSGHLVMTDNTMGTSHHISLVIFMMASGGSESSCVTAASTRSLWPQNFFSGMVRSRACQSYWTACMMTALSFRHLSGKNSRACQVLSMMFITTSWPMARSSSKGLMKFSSTSSSAPTKPSACLLTCIKACTAVRSTRISSVAKCRAWRFCLCEAMTTSLSERSR